MRWQTCRSCGVKNPPRYMGARECKDCGAALYKP